MQFMKLQTLSWNPSWYQKYSYAPQEVWQKKMVITSSIDPRKKLKSGKKNREACWGSPFPWWKVTKIG